MQRRWRRRQARLLLAPRLSTVVVRLRPGPAPPLSLRLRATGEERACDVRVWSTYAPADPRKKGAPSAAHVLVGATLHVRRVAVEVEVEEEAAGGAEEDRSEEDGAHLGGAGTVFFLKKRGAQEIQGRYRGDVGDI